VTEGLLQDVHLSELIQIIALNEKTGILELTPLFPATQQPVTLTGHLFFREGILQAARLDDRSGESAVENLFLWGAGRFIFRPLAETLLPPPNIELPHEKLILQGIKRSDRWYKAREYIPTMRVIPQRNPKPPASAPPSLHTPEGQLLAVCDGTSQLSHLSQRLPFGGLRCREAAAELLSQNFIRLMPPSAGEQLMRLIITITYPLLGIASEIFCEDAMRQTHIIPENLVYVPIISVSTVSAIVAEIERAVTLVLGPQRATALAQQLCDALGIAPLHSLTGREIFHV
jgi:Domain of unknown function (DUF4388)